MLQLHFKDSLSCHLHQPCLCSVPQLHHFITCLHWFLALLTFAPACSFKITTHLFLAKMWSHYFRAFRCLLKAFEMCMDVQVLFFSMNVTNFFTLTSGYLLRLCAGGTVTLNSHSGPGQNDSWMSPCKQNLKVAPSPCTASQCSPNPEFAPFSSFTQNLYPNPCHTDCP